ncbi:MAG: alkaline phosphatase family protein [Pseudomonadota bacterium]
MPPRYLVIQCAALGHGLLESRGALDMAGLSFSPVDSVFPALTCPVQAGFRTASPPSSHGMMFNGAWLASLARPSFWEQSSRLVEGERIWSGFRAQGHTVGMLFWQQSLGEDVDVLLSPWPVHKHGGGLVDVTYSKPAGLYDHLCRTQKSRFRLMDYWGPLANRRSSRWIAGATAEIMGMDIAPDLLFTYLPHLDYALQKYAPGHRRCGRSLDELARLLTLLKKAAARHGYEVLVYGDYAIGPASQALFPNRLLLEKGLLATRRVGGQVYPNLHESAAFAVVDHEIAHVFLRDPKDEEKAFATLAVLSELSGNVTVTAGESLERLGMAHPNGGHILLTGRPGTWFAYPWWTDPGEAPDFAGHIDIHNKPGYDPCELFFGKHPFRIGTDPGRIRGTHGTVGPDRRAAWAATFDLPQEPRSLLDLSRGLKELLDRAEP